MSKRQNLQVLVNENSALKGEVKELKRRIEGISRAGYETIDEFSKRAEAEIKKVQYDLSLALARLQQFEPHNNLVVEGIIQTAITTDVEQDNVGTDVDEAYYLMRAMHLLGTVSNLALYQGQLDPFDAEESMISDVDKDIDSTIYRLGAVVLKWLQLRGQPVAAYPSPEPAVVYTPEVENGSPTAVDEYNPADYPETMDDYTHAHPRD